jgi:hypothetical protein
MRARSSEATAAEMTGLFMGVEGWSGRDGRAEGNRRKRQIRLVSGGNGRFVVIVK